MKVLLLERIKKLGDTGDLVSVRSGFARNYLFIKKKALRFSKENQEKYQNEKKLIGLANNNKKALALEHSQLITGKTLTVIRQAGDDGQLYGSVSNKHIANLLNVDFQTKVFPESVLLNYKIKEVGLHDVRVYLHPEIEVKFQVNVARSQEEAKNALAHSLDQNLVKKTSPIL